MSVGSRESSFSEPRQTHSEIFGKVYLFIVFLLMDRKASAEQIRRLSLTELERNHSIIKRTAQTTLGTLDRKAGTRPIMFTREFGLSPTMSSYSPIGFIEKLSSEALRAFKTELALHREGNGQGLQTMSSVTITNGIAMWRNDPVRHILLLLANCYCHGSFNGNTTTRKTWRRRAYRGFSTVALHFLRRSSRGRYVLHSVRKTRDFAGQILSLPIVHREILPVVSRNLKTELGRDWARGVWSASRIVEPNGDGVDNCPEEVKDPATPVCIS
jgi:hypothetical protein